MIDTRGFGILYGKVDGTCSVLSIVLFLGNCSNTRRLVSEVLL